MPEYLLLMHDDAVADADDWGPYIQELQRRCCFEGGSEIGGGRCVRKGGTLPPLTAHLAGYVRVSATDFAGATSLLAGNPVYEAGGTVEIRELPRSDRD